jgi:lipopolysaccharide transport system ATP-binding protein
MALPMLSDELWTDDLKIAIRLQSVGKVYHIYDKPHDRLKQMLWPGRRRFHREFHALRGVDLEIHRGETVGVVGRNGSGKSTLLKLISGILQPTEGEIEVHGLVAPLLTIGGGFNPEFTGRENVFVNASILGLERHEIEERLDEIIRFADIGAFFDQPVRSYSSGMYSRLAFAVVIHSDPDILIVDEVLAVGDEAFSRKCFSRIEAIKEKGATILLASHSANTVIELCDRAVLIDGGERLLVGEPKMVVSNYQRLLYAPVEQMPSVLEEIRELDHEGASPETSAIAAKAFGIAPVDEELEDPEDMGSYDPELEPASTVEYLKQGARIDNVRILDARGRRVNVLRTWQAYTYAYDVEFIEAATFVRFGMMLKLTSGFELGGQVSESDGKGIELVVPGTCWEVRFQFKPMLVPGTYFLNAGVRGRDDAEEKYLHRIMDAAIFRIDPLRRGSITGHVDLSDGSRAEAKRIPELTQRTDVSER